MADLGVKPAAVRGELQSLGKLLGRDRDLWVLKQTIARQRPPRSLGAPPPRILKRINKRRRRLRTKILRAFRLYKPRPRAFATRLLKQAP